MPFLGIACAMMGHIFIDRSNRVEAMRTLDAFKATMQPGTSVMFFPEGTRSNGKPPLKFKQGAFSMAKDMDLPILPVTILGTEKILPKKTLNLMRGKSEIIFHPAIEIEQVRAMNVEELAIKSAQIVAGPITEESITEGVTA